MVTLHQNLFQPPHPIRSKKAKDVRLANSQGAKEEGPGNVLICSECFMVLKLLENLRRVAVDRREDFSLKNVRRQSERIRDDRIKPVFIAGIFW